MKLLKSNKRNISKRFKIVFIFTVILFGLLTFRLATLTIAKGEHFRTLSENMRIKDIYITAPRGEIRDRNGILLAGNKPMFTLQLLKDEFSSLDKETKNKYILDAVTLLERDSISYNSNFPMSIYNFEYKDTSDYFKTEITPQDRIVDIIIENNLIEEIISRYYKNNSEINNFTSFPAQNFINSLEFNSKNVPITFEVVNDVVVFNFIDGIELNSWYEENNIPNGTSPKDSLALMINDNTTIIKKLLANPINRKIVYEVISAKNLQENIIVTDYKINYERDYQNLKINLMNTYPEITMETTAQQDFLILFEKNSLKNFIKHEVSEEGINIPSILEKVFEENEIDFKYNYIVKENIPVYSTSDNSLEESLIIDDIFDTIIRENLLIEILEYERVLGFAQQQLISDGINSGISISDGFEYVPILNLRNFYEVYSIDENSSNEDIFNDIRDYYSINETISIPEVYAILNVYHELSRDGSLAYLPVNFSYGLKDETVAKFEEQLGSFDGFQVSLEPVRSYPYGEVGSHILGYMGKISQEGEIEKYINKQNYNPDTLIGKTGIEESFQENLYGENGYKRVEVDSLGNTSNVLEEIKPIPGDNVYLSLDYHLQKRSEIALDDILRTIRNGGTVNSPWGDYDAVWSTDNNRPYRNATSGAVMAIDVKTGEILSMASYPSYDPNLFSTGISNADWEGLIPDTQEDPLAPRPLYNVSTQTAIQPGSTFKMITALAGLEKGLDPQLEIDDRGYIEIGDTTFGCWLWNQDKRMHGPMDVVDAIRDSCNYYFYSLALGRNQQTGEDVGVKLEIEDIANMADKFGLGSETGMEINIPKEASQGVPNPQTKTEVGKVSLRRWLNNNIDRFYIGEGDLNLELKSSIVENIVSWMDKEESLSLQEVYTNLNNLKLDGAQLVDTTSRNTLADLIKFSYLNNSQWTISDTINITIGQGENSYTLAQMTNYVASITNGGYKNKLTLIDNVKNSDNTNVEFNNEPTTERIELNNYENLEYLKEGMRQAAISGLNRAVFEDFPVEVGIKTGTAQRSGINPVTNERYDSFAYEVGFAPYDDPRIAVGVVIFQGGSGANCSPIVREVIAEYMGLYRQEESDNLPIEMDLIP